MLEVGQSERCSARTRPRRAGQRAGLAAPWAAAPWCPVPSARVLEVPSHLPNVARPFPTSCACRGRLERRAAVRSPGLPCGPSAVACARVPEASSARPLVTRGSARRHKRGHGPWPRRAPASQPRPSCPPAPSQAAAASSGCGPTASQVAPSSTSSAQPTARQLVSPSPRAAPRRETATAAATFPGRRRACSPEPLRPRPTHQIDP
jgi:hypothetical protein